VWEEKDPQEKKGGRGEPLRCGEEENLDNREALAAPSSAPSMAQAALAGGMNAYVKNKKTSPEKIKAGGELVSKCRRVWRAQVVTPRRAYGWPEETDHNQCDYWKGEFGREKGAGRSQAKYEASTSTLQPTSEAQRPVPSLADRYLDGRGKRQTVKEGERGHNV